LRAATPEKVEFLEKKDAAVIRSGATGILPCGVGVCSLATVIRPCIIRTVPQKSEEERHGAVCISSAGGDAPVVLWQKAMTGEGRGGGSG
jgi:hypothetical protein